MGDACSCAICTNTGLMVLRCNNPSHQAQARCCCSIRSCSQASVFSTRQIGYRRTMMMLRPDYILLRPTVHIRNGGRIWLICQSECAATGFLLFCITLLYCSLMLH